MLHSKGTRGWMRALVIVMVSLALTLSMPAKPAMAAGLPVFDAASLAKLADSFVQKLADQIINMAMQKLMQEANKALGPVVNMPILGEFVGVVMDGMFQDLTDMVNRGSNDALAGIFRSPQKNFQDCMGNFACTANIKVSPELKAQFAGAGGEFNYKPPSELPKDLQTSYIDSYTKGGGNIISGIVPKGGIALAGPPVQADPAKPNVYTGVTTAGNQVVWDTKSSYGANAPQLAIAAGTPFFTPDGKAPPAFDTSSYTNADLKLNVGNGALSFTMQTAEGSSAMPTMTASPAAVAAAKKANATGQSQTFNGIEFNPGITIGNDGRIGGGVGKINFGGAQVSATVGANGVPAINVQDVGKALCPNLTEQDKAGGAVCRTADAAVSGLVGCAFGGNAGECAKGVGKNAGATLARGLLGSIRETLGVKGSSGASSASSGALQVAAADKALREAYFCPSDDNTAECRARVSAARNTDLAYSATEYIASAKAWQTKLPQMKKDCDDAVTITMEKGGGNGNTIGFAKIMQDKCYNGIELAMKMAQLQQMSLTAQQYLVTAPTALPGGGG
jgi:hypothetical protein